MSGGMHHDRDRAEGFGAEVDRYDRLRPSYPPELVAWLTEGGAGAAVDVGCGTGQVARLLVAAGWDVLGVEPDERMAARARERGVAVEVARFEEWEPSTCDVDLVCAGQAWHWVDPDRGHRRAAEVLRSGGRLAVFWNAYRYGAEVAAVLADVYGRHAPDLLRDSVSLGTADPRHHDEDLARLAASGLFDRVEARVFGHERELDVSMWLDELTTHSAYRTLGSPRTEELFSALRPALAAATGDTITVRHDTNVVSGVRSPPSA